MYFLWISLLVLASLMPNMASQLYVTSFHALLFLHSLT
jgi:hypothetical protein